MTSLTTASPVPKPSNRPDASESHGFFHWHGAWAPGVRLFRRMGFGSKSLVVGSVMALPLLVALWLLNTNWSGQIEFTQREREGVATMRALMPVLKGVLDTRNATRANLGGFDASAAYRASRAETDGAVLALRAQIKSAKDPLNLTSAVDQLDAAWRATASSKNGVDDSGRTVFGPVTAAGVELLTRIGDDSNLVLDPDLDSFYLVNALVLSVPKTLESLGQLWGWGTYAAMKGGLNPDNESKWHVWSAQVVSGTQDARQYFERATKANPSLAKMVDFKSFDNALKFHAQGQLVVFGQQSSDASKYFADGKHALDELMGLYDSGLPVLDGLLLVRINKLEGQQRLAFGMSVVSLLLAVYLFIAFRKVLEGGLREVVFHVNAMRDGDLTTQPHAWGKDEIAKLIHSVKDMQSSINRIVSRVRDASSAIVSASGEIASASVDLSQRTEQSAASLERSAASMEQISATVNQTADNVAQAAEVAGDNARVASQAGQEIAAMVSTMQGIHDASKRISEIISTIDGIAFQTNILALNAAVEAARAGEQGRGFAVVAGEVRGLAHRSAVAAREIKSLISGSVEQVDAGTQRVHGAGKSMGEMVSNASRINDLLSDISTAAREQSKGVATVGDSVTELDKMTQQNAALVEQTAAAAAALKDQANNLANEVASFRTA